VIAIHGAMLATTDDFHGPAATSRCARWPGLQPTAEGYGFLLALDDDGEPYTAVLWDVEYVRLLLSAWEVGETRDVTVPAATAPSADAWPGRKPGAETGCGNRAGSNRGSGVKIGGPQPRFRPRFSPRFRALKP
jgi:hypothetical protein